MLPPFFLSPYTTLHKQLAPNASTWNPEGDWRVFCGKKQLSLYVSQWGSKFSLWADTSSGEFELCEWYVNERIIGDLRLQLEGVLDEYTQLISGTRIDHSYIGPHLADAITKARYEN